MPQFQSDDVEIAYDVAGEGAPVLLIHGFASTARINWWDTGWVKTLNQAGYQAITFDNRGHGASGKLYDPKAYGAPTMAEDAHRLLDHLNISKAHVMGYSMGARIAAFLALAHPDRVRSAVFAGLAANMIRGVAGAEEIARGLEAPSLAEVAAPPPRLFRQFAEQTKSDLKALAACMRSSRQVIGTQELGGIEVPVLVVAGEMDEIAGPVEPLVNAIPGARGITLAHRNHMNAVGDQLYRQTAIKFFNSLAGA